MKKNKRANLTISQIISKLQAIKKSHGDMKVYFDTEAGQFSSHMVGIDGVRHVPKEWIGEQHAYFSTGDPIEHACQYMIDNIKINFALMVNRKYSGSDLKNLSSIKSKWQLEFLQLPVQCCDLPLTHKSDKAFFKKYWKLDKRTYEQFMKNNFPGWLKNDSRTKGKNS
jgi:hypothetical protein